MKRALAMLLAVAMLAVLLCGCASEGTKETQQTQQPQATEAAAEENVTEAQKPATATGTPKEIVETLVGDILDLSIYEVEEDEDGISYTNLEQKGSFPHEITFSGMRFQLDGVTTYQDLLDAGWNSNMPETADANYRYLDTTTGPEGQRLTITATNLNDEPIAIEETYLTSVMGIIKNSGGFTFGNLTENSTISDVLKAIGTPRYLYYNYESGNLDVKFRDNCAYQDSVSFTFDSDGVITKVDIDYSIFNLV